MADLRLSGLGGIPFGNTSARPASPAIGTVYYNGQLESLEIFNGTIWVASSAPPAIPSIATPTDASTGDAYTATAGKLSVVFTSGGGTPNQYNAYTTSGGFIGYSSSTTVNLTGLAPGTAYTVYGNAQNNFGTTANTVSAASVTPTTKPQAPTIGAATLSISGIVVNWTLNSNGGKSLASITITPYLNGVTAQASQTAATTSSISHTFTGLTEDASYTFKVSTTNANGTSLDSSASNSVTFDQSVSVDYLVIAGGGGGGGEHINYAGGGGGGAGGFRSSVTATGGGGALETALTVLRGTNYPVIVGSGGAATQQRGDSGTESVFSTISTTGGGGGGASAGGAILASGRNGGSGGGSGGSGNSGNVAGLKTQYQGYDGGPENSGGGGGGGAGAVGGSGGTGGNGGAGVATSITGNSVTRGGGGGGCSDTPGGIGGTGGGGASGHATGSPGSANTGGGGGAAGRDNNSGGGTGGAGGSGVVILRWLTYATTITVGAGLTSDSTGTDGSYSYKVFTAGSGNVSWS